MKYFTTFVISALLFFGCSDVDDTNSSSSRGDTITRRDNEYLNIPSARKNPAPKYPWEKNLVANLPKITKEYFRCKGSYLNPEKTIEQKGTLVPLKDCGGTEKHSLPLNEEKEFIYPILITLLNHIQKETEKRVVITSGHRCPDHNTYVDSSSSNRYSKHMIGAEVSFYVQGMEESPQEIVDLIFKYYQDDPELAKFQRYEKSDTNVSIKPWYNKEVYIKLFNKEEGRNFDNRHPYPYIAIQVRHDRDKKERVNYNWDNAYKNYLRK